MNSCTTFQMLPKILKAMMHDACAFYVNLSTKTETLLTTLALNIYLWLTSHNSHPYYLTTSHPKSKFHF